MLPNRWLIRAFLLLFNRWFILSVALLSIMCQGISYTPSNFKHAIMPQLTEMPATPEAERAWGLAFSMGFVFLPLGMYLGGLLSDKGRVRSALLIGAFANGIGLVLAGFAENFTLFIIGFGVLLSIGGGFSYGTCVGAAVRWFPDKKGLASGLAVAALGVGGMLIPLFQNYLLPREPSAPSPLSNPMHYFFWQALISFVFIGLASLVVRNPPKTQNTVNAALTAVKTGEIPKQYTTSALLKNPTFYLLFAAMFLGTLPGFMLSANARPLIEFMENVSIPRWAPWIMAFWGLFNAIGRLASGYISDKAGRKKTLRYIYVLAPLLTLGLALVPSVLSSAQGVAGLFLFSGIAALFGGVLSLYPALTAETFGSNNIGKNYALMFCAFSLAALVGPYIVSLFRSGDIIDYTMLPWIACIAGALALVCSFVAFKETNKKTTE